MSVITGNKVIWRVLILAVFILSMLGPWTYDLLSVPAPYPCEWPVVRLEGDFCGYPMSGFSAVIWAASGLSSMIWEAITGNNTLRITELVSLVFMCIIVLPFFTTALNIWKKRSRRLQIIDLAMWGIACLPALALFLLQTLRPQVVHFLHLVWGTWVYILLAVSVLIVESLIVRAENAKDNNSSPSSV